MDEDVITTCLPYCPAKQQNSHQHFIPSQLKQSSKHVLQIKVLPPTIDPTKIKWLICPRHHALCYP